jgi:pilus assembly protein Flp/PilA
MKKMLNWLSNEESGQGMVEYGLIIAGVAVAIVVVIFTLGEEIAEMFNGLVGKIPDVT